MVDHGNKFQNDEQEAQQCGMGFRQSQCPSVSAFYCSPYYFFPQNIFKLWAKDEKSAEEKD